MTDIHQQRFLILDFGSQYTQLIARRVRELGAYCEIHPHDLSAAAIIAFKPLGVILSGGPESVTAEDTPRAQSCIFELGVPVLGICYGMQTLAAQLGGEVQSAAKREFGSAQLTLADAPHNPLLRGLGTQDKLNVWMSHGDKVTALPPGFVSIAQSDNAPFAAIADLSRQFYGLQCHPEVTHTEQGGEILRRFIIDICGCDGLWTPGNIVQDAIERIRAQVGQDQVILGLSGGVDSSVVAALLHKAIGSQLTCVFVDNGLLRYQEAKQVVAMFGEHMQINLIAVDAKQQFLQQLAGQTDPEQKRKIVGNVFIQVFEAEAAKIPAAKWLAQGTIYPDVIESAASKTGKAHVIKSHHNVGGLPEEMALQLLEPLRELFKDEVRRIGLELGLPHEMVYRHPFPGPGLSVRILGEVKPEYVDLLQRADHIFIEELRRQKRYDDVSQAFAVFLPVKSVGVMGDARCYDYVVALRCVTTIDFMTATWSELPFDFLKHVSNRIINEVKGISRVVYDISGKPPATIEWE